MEDKDAWHLTDDLHHKQGKGDPFAAAIRSTRMPMIVTDPKLPDNPIVFANDAFLRMTGYARSEVQGFNCRFLQGRDTDPATIRRIGEAIRRREDISVDILNYRKNGEAFWNALYLSPVIDDAGTLQYFFGSQFDASERIRHETEARLAAVERARRTLELERANETQRLLIHEIDHRVKNNLQMISAMLMLQVLSLPDPDVQKVLQEMLGRIDAIGLVHRRLYEAPNVTRFNVAEFTRDIVGCILAVSGRQDIHTQLDLTDCEIGADNAACLALILNEALTNAVKHGFANGRPGRLRVALAAEAGRCAIEVSDDGHGLPESWDKKPTFGTRLIATLGEQLGAAVRWVPALPGTHFSIAFETGGRV